MSSLLLSVLSLYLLSMSSLTMFTFNVYVVNVFVVVVFILIVSVVIVFVVVVFVVALTIDQPNHRMIVGASATKRDKKRRLHLLYGELYTILYSFLEIYKIEY